MTTTESPAMPLAERISQNVLTLMPSRGLRYDADLAKLLGWTPAKTSRRLHLHKWQVDDLDHIASKLQVSVADLMRSPEEYLPGSKSPKITGQ